MKEMTFYFKSQRFFTVFFLSFLFLASCKVSSSSPTKGKTSQAEVSIFNLATTSLIENKKEKNLSNEAQFQAIRASFLKNREEENLLTSANKVSEVSESLEKLTEQLRDEILLASGGKNAKGHPNNPGQKVAAQKILKERSLGQKLQTEIIQTKVAWLQMVPKKDRLAVAMQLAEPFQNDQWVSQNTDNLSVGVLQISFAQLLLSTEQSKGVMLTYFSEKIKNANLAQGQFEVMSTPVSSYIKLGERYESKIYLGSIYKPAEKNNMSIKANGSQLIMEDGVGSLLISSGEKLGKKSINTEITITDPLTGEKSRYQKNFTYHVGAPESQIQATKMNVFYIGVQNPVTISVPGIPQEELKISMVGASIRSGGKNYYTVTANRPGECQIVITHKEEVISKMKFRVKRIPDPVARVSKSQGGIMGVGEFRSQGGVGAFLDNFDFDAKCQIQGYVLTRIEKNGETVSSVNKGSRYNSKSKGLIQLAKPGDIYTFEKVKAKCPGDPAGRMINTLLFNIK